MAAARQLQMFTLGELADAVGGKVKGDAALQVSGYCSIEHPRSGCITFAEKAKEASRLKGSGVAAVVTTEGLSGYYENSIISASPKQAFAEIVQRFRPKVGCAPGIDGSASICPSALVDETATIGPLVALGENVRIGARSVLHPGVVVSENSVIGEDCVIGPNVSICDGVTIGDRVVINAGTVIGGLGFGFISTRERHTRFPQVGGVVIEDDVEIGSNCCVDRASLDDTVIHKGTKIDNLVQIAHGVTIGEHTMIAAQVGISGGTTLGNWCVVGGQAGFQGHISVGDQSIVGGGSAVFSDLPEKSKVSGYPAKPHAQALKVLALTFRLPEMLDRMRSLEIELEMMRGELQSLRDHRNGDDLPPAGMA